MAQIRNLLLNEYHFTTYQLEKMKYVLLSLLSEITKFMLIISFFLIMHKLPELIVSTIVLICIRCFTGGIHLKHYLSCLILTFCIFFIGIYILPMLISINSFGMILVLNICIILIYLIGPVPSSYRPPLSAEQKNKCKIIAVTTILIFIYIIIVFQEASCISAGFWIIVLQTLQLGFAKIFLLTKGEEKNEAKNC